MYGAFMKDYGYGVWMFGEGGKDIINTEIYEGVAGYAPDLSGVYIWGDWNYGTEDDPNPQVRQYGDPRLEKKLHGDDD